MTEVSKIETGEALPVDPMVSMIERVVMNPDVPMERVHAMFDLQERQLAKAAEQAFNVAFAAAMAEMPDIPQSGENKHLGTRYSTLDDLIRTTRPVLSRHGLSLNWETGTEGAEIWAKAIVRHASGHQISTTSRGPRDSNRTMNPLQGGGSTETYMKRYSGFAILGLSSGDERDDDGHSSGATQGERKPNRDPWLNSILEDMPPDATDRDKASAIARALCAQFQRMKGERQLGNEWDRRVHLIEGERALEGKHPDLHETVVDAYENKLNEIKDQS